MTSSDVTTIEQALDITLPESYRQAVVPFRVDHLTPMRRPAASGCGQ